MRLKTLKKEKLAGNVKTVLCSKTDKGYSCAVNLEDGSFDVVTTERGDKRFFASLETLKRNMEKAEIFAFTLVG